MSTHSDISKPAVRKIMKLNDDVSSINLEGNAVVAKAADIFLVHLIRDCMVQATSNHRLGICVDDVIAVVEQNQQKYEFLNGPFGNRR